MQGVITSFLQEKAYGFIRGDDDRDYFFHAQDLIDEQQQHGLRDGMKLAFDPLPTAKGYRAKSVRMAEPFAADADAEQSSPDVVATTRHRAVPGRQLLEHSDWLVQGSSRQSPQAARQDAAQHAQRIGANGLVEFEYFKTTGSEPGTGQGVHHFTVHHYRGRAVRLGPGAGGQSSIREQAERYEQQLREAVRVKKEKKLWGYAMLIGAFLLLLGIDRTTTVASMSPLVMLAAAAAAFIGWLSGRYEDGILHPLFYSPSAEVGARAPSERSNRREQSGRSSGPIRSFVVDEGKLSEVNAEEQSFQSSGKKPSFNIDGTPMMGILDSNGHFYGEV